MITQKQIKHYMNRGGFWLMVANDPQFRSVLAQIKQDSNVDIHAMQCETVEDAIKLNLLVEAFNTWTVEGIREFMKQNKNFPKIEL